MTNADPILCPANTYARTMVSPEEFCETEVEQEGDLCPAHEEPDDDFDYERYLEDKAERASDPDYYRDFGD